VQAFNAQTQEGEKFHHKVNTILGLARKEAIASGIFFGSTGWGGNITVLTLLGYGQCCCHPNLATLLMYYMQVERLFLTEKFPWEI
jgi:hypothetical protein